MCGWDGMEEKNGWLGLKEKREMGEKWRNKERREKEVTNWEKKK